MEPGRPWHDAALSRLGGAAEKLGVKVQALGVRAPDEFEAAFSAMDAERPDAILMVADLLTNLNRKRVIDFAHSARLPAIYELHSSSGMAG